MIAYIINTTTSKMNVHISSISQFQLQDFGTWAGTWLFYFVWCKCQVPQPPQNLGSNSHFVLHILLIKSGILFSTKELNQLKMKEMFSLHLQSKSTLSNHSTAFGSRPFVPGCASTLQSLWQRNCLQRLLPAPVLSQLFPCSRGVPCSLVMQFNVFPSSA